MKITRLLKSILISALGISVIGSVAAVSTSCSRGSANPDVVHVSSVELNKRSITLDKGEKIKTLKATVLPENATNKLVTWSSNDTSVATIDQDGKITAVDSGEAIITVTTNDGGYTDTCVVKVSEGTIHVTSVELNKRSTTLTVGETDALVATISPENATDKSVTWSTSDWTVAIVNQNGTVAAIGVGNATITVTTNDGDKTATCAVKVNPIHVTSVDLNKNSTTLSIGETDTLKATVLPTTATDKSVVWSSSHPNIAKVNQNGKITAVGLGDATITVTTNDGSKTATCAVEVTNTYVTNTYVTIIANENSTLTLNNNGENNPDLQYSIDGISWSAYSSQLHINKGQTLYLKGNNPTGWSHSIDKSSTISITGDVSISGNIMGLLDNGAKPEEQGNITNIPCKYCFYDLFRESTGITSVSDDFLPATTLVSHCYNGMFSQCESLVKAPELPATTLAEGCYTYMFSGCTALTTAPELSATTLADSCYSIMFSGCTSLTSAPELPATTLAPRCYFSMFECCTSLTTAPELPATTLAKTCYDSMFYGCTSLTIAPRLSATTLVSYCYASMFSDCTSLTVVLELPSTSLAGYCYSSMFSGCTSLTVVPELPATTLTNNCYEEMFKDCSSLNSIKIGYKGNYSTSYFRYWVSGVASSGTFYYNGSDTCANFGFPSGWESSPF